MYYVYFLKSLNRNWYYVGHTDNLKERLARHNRGGVQSTRPYRPLKIVYFEAYINRATARRRELDIKTNRKQKEIIISRLQSK